MVKIILILIKIKSIDIVFLYCNKLYLFFKMTSMI